MKKYVYLTLLLLLGAEGAFSQKRPMKLDDCKLWRSVDQIQLSADGNGSFTTIVPCTVRTLIQLIYIMYRREKRLVKPGFLTFRLWLTASC